jgi:hypothetical protein
VFKTYWDWRISRGDFDVVEDAANAKKRQLK